MKKIKVDKVILYYMDRVDPDGNLYRFYVYKGMASEIEYFCTEKAGNMTIPIGEGEYVKIVPKEIEKIPVRGLMGLKECSREEAFAIIQEWAKEFTEKYGDFDGSYYDVIDEFIEEKLRTI